ncbi:uncharacterized protein CC84DRAFT_1120220 [Paraphaeosphaeria sporulosa]|uniref:Glycosyl transferase CAP10 domain-containing protein n=1 Tax=Paraphaeosphaeria sporulosa TaxID=1460663 RepID=A0A177CHT7_9PLEO|nr:uncharacterized protein CC84DRAFT_1120220 [Paraphaeosphaeria sporulosa]OAG06360.1 hypothetical protein CC84DRAFT_1120220 [Paraphaeosphaeria sporulosa]
MHAAVSSVADHARRNHHIVVPLLFVVLAATANVHAPVQHQLLITSVSWLAVCMATLFWAGARRTHGPKRRTSWLAGGFLALSQICERAACDKEGMWSTKGLLPLLVVLLSEIDVLPAHLALPTHASPTSPSKESAPTTEQHIQSPSFRLLSIATLSASLVLSTGFTASPTFALGVSSVIFAAVGFVLFDQALRTPSDGGTFHKSPQITADGSLSRAGTSDGPTKKQQLAVLRDLALVMALACGLAAYLMEPRITSSTISWEPVYRFGGGSVKTVRHYKTVKLVLVLILVNVLVNGMTFLILSRQSVVHTSCLYVFACICSRLRLSATIFGVWLTFVYGVSALTFLNSSSPSSSIIDMRNSVRLRRALLCVTALSVAFFFLHDTLTARYGLPQGHLTPLHTSSPVSPYGPVQIDMTKGHPAAQLIESAEKDFRDLLRKQSKTLKEAVVEYRRRNGIAPPPHFDKWYEFATRNGVVLIDEFDTITDSLLPYWSLKPSTIRSRIRNALGNEDSALIAILIRDGSIAKAEGDPEWQRNATAGMLEKFVQYLPDMDLGFNIHDEPRVVVPNDHLSAMVAKAQKVLSTLAKNNLPKNSFSERPSDVNNGHRIEEVSYSRFNRFAHQQTWTHSRLSCPAQSQAQQFEDQVPDNLTAYAAGPLNYVLNQSAFTDICNSPSFSGSYGFFERPNSFSIVHELTPIFSQSKISSFQDILYPSPWYWFGKVGYDDWHDTKWENKTNSLYWRGSTTGGFSRKGGWRRQHRQRIVRRLNALDKANISVPAHSAEDTSPALAHEVQEVDRTLYRSLVDVKFSHIGQCDPGDCDAQREFFFVAEHADGQDAWYYKHLLDMDGNAFSGRFYSFLKSRSLTYKMAVFREWHNEWLKPWVHYIPFSLIGDEHLDLVRWFSGEDVRKGESEANKEANKGGNGDSLGEKKAREIAERSTQWSGKALRNVDFEAWMFRLLLEYGRVIDDDRENIGYPGP